MNLNCYFQILHLHIVFLQFLPNFQLPLLFLQGTPPNQFPSVSLGGKLLKAYLVEMYPPYNFFLLSEQEPNKYAPEFVLQIAEICL
jgi:hypothetical protein